MTGYSLVRAIAVVTRTAEGKSPVASLATPGKRARPVHEILDIGHDFVGDLQTFDLDALWATPCGTRSDDARD